MPPPRDIEVRSQNGDTLLKTTLPSGIYLIGADECAALRIQGSDVRAQHCHLVISEKEVLLLETNAADPSHSTTVVLSPMRPTSIGSAQLHLHQSSAPEKEKASSKYALGSVITRGSSGQIHNAVEKTTGRRVAMKLLPVSANDETDSDRFLAEAKITAQLEHPGVVPVYELGTAWAGRRFYTMKLVDGITLAKILEDIHAGNPAVVHKYPLAALLAAFQKVCDAIAYAHSRGILHRNLKPENITLGAFGEVLVTNWSVAIHINSLADPHSHREGEVIGTARYMSPEQARAENSTLDPRSDIYSLGAILFRILSLRSSVADGPVLEILERVGRGRILPLKDPPRNPKVESHLPGGRIPASLAAIVNKAMAFDRNQRYACVSDLLNDLDGYRNGYLTSAERGTWWKRGALFLWRHRITSVAAAFVLIFGGALAAKSLIAARQAGAALAKQRSSAPILRQLAQSEAASQRLASALKKLDTALQLDPDHLPTIARMAWINAGLARMNDAASLMRNVIERDPANEEARQSLPLFEKLARLPPRDWSKRGPNSIAPEDTRSLVELMTARGLTGETLALGNFLTLSSEQKQQIITSRLEELLGKSGNWDLSLNQNTSPKEIRLIIHDPAFSSLEPLRGLPLDALDIAGTSVTDISPLRGMDLKVLKISGLNVSDISVVQGMPLRNLDIRNTQVFTLAAIRGASLAHLHATGCPLPDFRPLKFMPQLQYLSLGNNLAPLELSLLTTKQIVSLSLDQSGISDLSPLTGQQLERLSISSNPVSDLSPLKGMPIVELHMLNVGQPKGMETLATMPNLTSLHISSESVPFLPAALLKKPDLKIMIDPAPRSSDDLQRDRSNPNPQPQSPPQPQPIPAPQPPPRQG